MAYNYNNFLKPISDDDKNLLIYDDSGKLVYTINPFSITNIQVRANIITISVKSQRTILLDFLDGNLAKDALPILQQRIFTLTEKTPNFIDKQVENWVLGQSSIVPSFYGTVSIFGTLSMDGNIIPSLDYTWNIGSPELRWNNIYVRDALVASQSLYLGDTKISSKDGMIMSNDIAISRYEGTSDTLLSTPAINQIVVLNTQTNLSYKYGDTLKVFNKEENFAEDDNYSEDSIYSYFIGRVDSYNHLTGQLSLVVNYNYNEGITFSSWFIKLNTDVVTQVPSGLATVSVSGDILPDLDYTRNIGSPTLRWNNIYVRDALVASQSLYLGDIKISTIDGTLLTNNRAISRYEGTADNILSTPEVGQIVSLNTQTNLSYKYGDSLKIYNKEENFTEDDDYSEDSVYSYFIGRVDNYNLNTGLLTVVVNANYNTGLTFSSWFIKLNTDIYETQVTTFGTVSVYGDIIPNTNKAYKLGDNLHKWSDLFVENIIGDGDITLSEGKHLYSGGLRFSSRITGTSSDLLTVLDKGYYIELTTQKYLSFERGISVIVSNGLEDFYVDDEYYEDANGAVMFSIVDSYNETTGLLGLYVEKPIGLGRTASSWTINISGRQSTLESGASASFSELTITGTTQLQQVVESLTTATAAFGVSPSTFDLNFNNSSIFYVEPDGDNFVANFLNVPTSDNKVISTTIIISQSASAYIPTVVQINGDIIPISWANGTLPSGNANQTDIVGFSFLRIGATWSKVFGQLSTFNTI